MNTSQQEPITLWVFKVLTTTDGIEHTVLKEAGSALLRLGLQGPESLRVGDVVSIPSRGWVRITEASMDADGALRAKCTNTVTEDEGSGTITQEVLAESQFHCFAPTLPALIKHGDTLLCGRWGARFYATVAGIEFHRDGTWIVKEKDAAK